MPEDVAGIMLSSILIHFTYSPSRVSGFDLGKLVRHDGGPSSNDPDVGASVTRLPPSLADPEVERYIICE